MTKEIESIKLKYNNTYTVQVRKRVKEISTSYSMYVFFYPSHVHVKFRIIYFTCGHMRGGSHSLSYNDLGSFGRVSVGEEGTVGIGVEERQDLKNN